jgi:TfoX/Sxy family transcriptional regulator of competence genes
MNKDVGQHSLSLFSRMPYNENLAQRIRDFFIGIPDVSEKEKFGGLSFLIGNKLYVRVDRDELLLRCKPEKTEILLDKKGAHPYYMKGKPVQGWLIIRPEGTQARKDLNEWLHIALEYDKK